MHCTRGNRCCAPSLADFRGSCRLAPLLSPVLPSLSDVAGRTPTRREPDVPTGWPGTQCPNFSNWQAGDIVLVHKDQSFAGRIVPAAQAVTFNKLMYTGRHVTHVGVYLGSGKMIDAMPGRDIGVVSVFNYCQNRAVQVRRLADSSLLPSSGADIARAALVFDSKPYSMMQAVFAKFWPNTKANPKRLYCSTLVEHAVYVATQVDLTADPKHQPLYPGVLLYHRNFPDVLLEWRSL